jgi:hypothetical protein
MSFVLAANQVRPGARISTHDGRCERVQAIRWIADPGELRFDVKLPNGGSDARRYWPDERVTLLARWE